MFLIIFLITTLVAVYFHLSKNHNYWKSRGIDGPKPVMGTNWQIFFKTIDQCALENTRKYGKIYGLYFGGQPILIVANPQLIKQICIKDFHIFPNRMESVAGDSKVDRELSNLMGNDWKNMRSISSPTFSMSKMRKMHPIIIECVERFKNELENQYDWKGKNEIQLKKMMSSLTLDVIFRCVFATQVDIYSDPNNKFVTNAHKVIDGGWRLWLFGFLLYSFPKSIDWFGLRRKDPEAYEFFKDTIRSIIARRQNEKNKEYNDYLQVLIDVQNKQIEKDVSDEGDSQNDSEYSQGKAQVNLTEDDVLANSILFLSAGYEESSFLLIYLFYSLAMNEKCQQRLYEEVKAFNGNYDYDTISNLTYLEACVTETLRFYTPVMFSLRVAEQDYKLGETGISIEKGTLVLSDFLSIHHSPEYYENPQIWDPERFMPENRSKLVPYTYLPFGAGPRNCVGMRFALMEAKTAIAHLVNRFRFTKSSNTPLSLKPKKLQVNYDCGEIIIGIELREQ